MPQVAEFEEKTYEKLFGQELARGRPICFPPGQVLENLIGFDDAFALPWHDFFLRFPFPFRRWPQGWPGVRWSDLDRFANDLSSQVPHLKFNLFVQYKRPEYVEGRRAAEWSYWHRAYFRYQINESQQATLERLHQACAGRAVVVYASPAMWKNEDLFTAAAKRQVVAKSNIASVERLKGHGRYTYAEPGGNGRAYSEPEDIESPDIETVIATGLQQKELPFNQHIKLISAAIEKSLNVDEAGARLLKLARAAIIGEGKEAGELSPESFSYALVTVIAFSDAFNVSIYALG